MSRGVVSQRVSEIIGVASFAIGLLWLIALGSYSPTDPVWFFRAAGEGAPSNFAGRVGAFIAEASYQLFGFSSFLIPTMLGVVGWHYFWCRSLTAPYTKAIGGTMLLLCVATLLGLAFGNVHLAGTNMAAGGFVGSRLAGVLAD